MFVFPRHRLVVLAIPKTASTAIDIALTKNKKLRIPVKLAGTRAKHLSYVDYKTYIENFALSLSNGQEYDVFGIFREPISWLNSWYRFRQRDGVPTPAVSTKDLSFDQFAEACLSRPSPKYAVTRWQSSFVCDGDGVLRANKLFRYDEMNRAKAFLEERLEVSIDLEKVNVSPKKNTILSADNEQAIQVHLARDFKIYAEIG